MYLERKNGTELKRTVEMSLVIRKVDSDGSFTLNLNRDIGCVEGCTVMETEETE